MATGESPVALPRVVVDEPTIGVDIGAKEAIHKLVWDLANDEGYATVKYLGQKGHEFGATSGRQRRCGWLDIVSLRRSLEINSVTGICITKLDVLDELEEIRICTGYKLGDKVLDYLPAHAAEQAAVEPIYEEFEGWEGTTVGARSWADLPGEAVKYVRRIEELIRCPVALLSTSPEREDTILVTDPFAD